MHGLRIRGLGAIIFSVHALQERIRLHTFHSIVAQKNQDWVSSGFPLRALQGFTGVWHWACRA